MIFTSTGLMGDFVLTWPIASWYYKQTGEKITFVVPDAPWSKGINELTMMQPFTENLIKIPYNITDYSRGGQPYKFNPADFGIKGEYLNLGYRDYPRENWIPYYMAEEYGLGVDLDYVINVEGKEGSTSDIVLNLPFLQTAEQKKIYNDCGKREWGHYMISNYVPSRAINLIGKNGLYQDLVAMKNAQHTYVSESGLANIIDLMHINCTIYYKEKHAHPGGWFEELYYRPGNLKRHFISIPENNIEPQLDPVI